MHSVQSSVLTSSRWCWACGHIYRNVCFFEVTSECYFTARDGGRHWSGTAGSGARKHAMFLRKSGHQNRAPIVRGDMEPDIDESDVHPLSQPAYWYRHPGSVHRGSNKLCH